MSPQKDLWFKRAVADGIVDALWDAGLEIGAIKRMGRTLAPPDIRRDLLASVNRVTTVRSDLEKFSDIKQQIIKQITSDTLIQEGDLRLRIVRSISRHTGSLTYEAVYENHGKQRHVSVKFYVYPIKIPSYDLIRRRLGPFRQFQCPFRTTHLSPKLTMAISDWVEGPDLMEWILVGSWSDPGWWRTLAKIVDDTLVGLHFMHSRGVFHRDARLENVVFQPDRTICMIDTQIAFVDPDASEIDYAIRFDYGLFLDSLVQTLDGLIWPIRHQSDQARGITERNLLNLRDRLKSNAPDLGQITGRILPEKIRSDVAKTFDHFISQLKPVMRGKLIVTEDETAFSL